MDYPAFNNIKILLASKSPRRRALLKELGVKVEIIEPFHDNESYPLHLKAHEIPLFLAIEKAKACPTPQQTGDILLTADTIVWLNDEVIEKPAGRYEAFQMLRKLSGRTHEVFTGVCLTTCDKQVAFFDSAKVYFKELSNFEIEFYLDHYKPYDKAGAYGIQEWIGFIGIEKIEGSYFNVVGLPIQKVYQEILKLIS
jgi:septum formation protein